jgi:hypothetical protein
VRRHASQPNPLSRRDPDYLYACRNIALLHPERTHLTGAIEASRFESLGRLSRWWPIGSAVRFCAADTRLECIALARDFDIKLQSWQQALERPQSLATHNRSQTRASPIRRRIARTSGRVPADDLIPQRDERLFKAPSVGTR